MNVITNIFRDLAFHVILAMVSSRLDCVSIDFRTNEVRFYAIIDAVSQAEHVISWNIPRGMLFGKTTRVDSSKNPQIL